jgi:hypothetical protein
VINRLIEIGRSYGLEMSVEKTKVLRISRQPSPIQIGRSKTAEECGIFQLFE